MSTAHSQGLPRPRTLIHPGLASPVRIRSLRSKSARHVRLSLRPGATLHDAIVGPLAEADIAHASLTILGGWFDTFSYCVAPPDPTGRAVIAYTQPIDAGASTLVFGNATVGRSLAGKTIVHCHAAFVTARDEVRGGHVLTEACRIGAAPIVALVTSLDEFVLQQAFDQETNIPLLQPAAAPTGEPCHDQH